jgi:hypothetical protein
MLGKSLVDLKFALKVSETLLSSFEVWVSRFSHVPTRKKFYNARAAAGDDILWRALTVSKQINCMVALSSHHTFRSIMPIAGFSHGLERAQHSCELGR